MPPKKWFMCFVLFTRPIIQILDQYIKQDGAYMSADMQMAFKYWTIWCSYQQFEY